MFRLPPRRCDLSSRPAMADKDSAILPQGHNATELQKRHPNDIDYHLKEWSSGTRGGGSVPADLSWNSNPKQYQEENGSGALRVPADALRDSTPEDKR